jgi:hypothetical protein
MHFRGNKPRTCMGDVLLGDSKAQMNELPLGFQI